MTNSDIAEGSEWESTNRGHRRTTARVLRANANTVQYETTTKRDSSHRNEVFRQPREAFLSRYRRKG